MEKKLKIAIGCDHAGFEFKKMIIERLRNDAFMITDFGTNSTNSVDYPDFVHPLSISIESGETDFGILICGTANGVAMTANKHKGIRAAVAWKTELASLARRHNDANVICIPSRFIEIEPAMAIIREFLTTGFDGGRHEARVEKIPCEN